MLHFHGGGFICMSPKSHQAYTRKWANSTEIVIFSVNYKKAP